MSELIWMNGEVMPMAEASVGVEDRGYQFADGVYEVIRLYGGRAFAMDLHLRRLERSCGGIALAMPMPQAELAGHIEALVKQTRVKEGMVYLQVTRGCAPRNHQFSECQPTVLFYTRALEPVAAPGAGPGVKLLSVADERWKRCWVKSIALLANVLAKNQAIAAGADEAAFVENGWVSECSASNLFIIHRGTLLTHPIGPKVLPGITREVLLDVAGAIGVAAVERPITEAEALMADEVFIASTTREVSWVEQWNGRGVGRGQCGPITLKLHRALQEVVKRQTA